MTNLSNIHLNDYNKKIPILSDELNIVQNVVTASNQNYLSVNLEQKQTLLSKEVIVQLQEVQNYNILQITSKKEEIDFNGTPCLEWLKGRNDRLYNEIVGALSRGSDTVRKFSEIVEINKNSDTISHKDWKFITSHIEGFKNGFEFFKENRAKTNDPIVHKVLDYITPKTQQRIEVLKQYLSTKTKEPEILFELKNVDTKESTYISTINDNSCEKTNNLLDFLVKDLKWYKWVLEDKKQLFISYSLQYLQLTRSITHSLTINETTQVV